MRGVRLRCKPPQTEVEDKVREVQDRLKSRVPFHSSIRRDMAEGGSVSTTISNLRRRRRRWN